MKHAYVVIMAGGKGERFWPLSTGNIPKPFLNITGDKTLIQSTVERAMRIVSAEKIYVVLGKKHLAIARRQLPFLPLSNFIIEPEGKDTAPCIGLAAITLLESMEHHMPELYKGLLEIKGCLGANKKTAVSRIFAGLTKISIDYGLMQKARNVAMVPARFAWDDIGTWASLARASIADGHGNAQKGSVVSIDTKGYVIHGKGVTIGAIGVSGLVIVATKDSVLVCDIDRTQEVREIAKQLSARTEKARSRK